MLRPIKSDDIGQIVDWHNDPESLHLWSTRRNILSTSEANDEAIRDLTVDKHVWLIAENAAGTVIGMIFSYDVQFVDEHCFVTTYVADSFRQRGYGPDMLGLFLDYLFCYFNFRKIYFDAYEYNRASWHSMSNFGFKEEGRFPEHRYMDGRWHGLIRFAAYRNDIDKIRSYLARRR